MNCTFFGCRIPPSNVNERLKIEIVKLIKEKNVSTFYVGNNGGFDAIVQRVLKEIKRDIDFIEYYVVLSRLGELAICGEQDKTIFPEGLEYGLPRFAICRRNDWMINNSHYVIGYPVKITSKSYDWVQKAVKKGLELINLNE